MEENNNLNELPKKKGSSTIVLIVVCVVAFAVGFAVSFFTGDKKDKKDTKGTSNEVSNVESNSNQASNEVSNQTSNEVSNTTTSNSNSNTNTNVVSSELQKDIRKKISFLIQADDYKSGELMTTIGGTYRISQVFENNMYEEYKSFIVLYNMKSAYEKKITINDVSIKDKIATDYLKNNPDTYSFYNGTEFKKTYKKLYGTNPNFVDTTACPAYQYDSKSGDYVSISGCGLEGGAKTYIYIPTMTVSNKTLYAKVYVGTTEDFDGKTAYYYHDYYKDNKNKKGSKFTTINDSNKKDFAMYTFVFKCDANGNYYFSKVTK